MLINISLFVLSDLYYISFWWEDIAFFIPHYFFLYNLCHPILLFNIFCMSGYIPLGILVRLYDIGLDFVWISLFILKDLCCYLDSFISLFYNLSLFFKSIRCFKYFWLLFNHVPSTIFCLFPIYHCLCVIYVFDNLW